MNQQSEISPEAVTSAEEARKSLEAALNYRVTSVAEYTNAAEELKALSARAKELESMRKELKAPALESAKRIDDFFREPQQFIDDAKRAIKRALSAFDEEQQRIRREAERKAQEEERKERERMQLAAAKKEEAARRKREAEEQKAAEMEAAGRAAEAEERRRIAAEREEQRLREVEAARVAAETRPAAPVAHIETPEVRGISSREVWKFSIEDEAQIPREFLQPDEKKIGAYVRAMKRDAKIAGVHIYPENVISSRSA